MALDMKIGNSAYESLPADVKKEYVKDGSDYRLDVKGYEDPAELRRARDAANQERNDAKRERDAHKADLDKANTKIGDLEKGGGKVDDAVKAKDTEWQKKYDTDLAAKDTTITGLRNSRINDKKTELATTLANKLSNSPSLLVDHLAKRINVEINEDGSLKHSILDSAGKPSAGTMEDLEKEALKNKEWAPIMRGTKANGGGGALPVPGGGGAPRSDVPHRPGTPENNLATMDPVVLAAQIRERREQRGS